MTPKQKTWTTGKTPGPYNGNFEAYDAYIGQYRRDRNFWRTAALISLGIVGLCIPAMLYLGSLPAVVPHVIEVATWGEARNVGAVGSNIYDGIERSQRSIQFYLRQFVRNIRSVSTDVEVIKSRLSTAFRSVTRPAYTKLQREVANSNIFVRSQNGRVEVVVHSFLAVSSSSYQIDWMETTYSTNGKELERHLYRGLFNIVFAEPSREQVSANPLGIFVDGYDIQEIEVKK